MSSPPSRQSDLFLARSAAAGRSEAWDRLIELYGGRLYNLAYQFAGERAEAEDLTQEIFLKLFQNLRSYRGDVPLIAWALRLSRNLCIDHYRRSRARRRSAQVSAEILEHLPGLDDPRQDAQRREELRLVYRALEQMSEDLATVLILRDLQGWSYDEVAAALGAPLGTIKSRINRARQDLSRRIARHLDVDPRPPRTDRTAKATGAAAPKALPILRRSRLVALPAPA